MSEFILQQLIDDGKLEEASGYLNANFENRKYVRNLYKSVISLTRGNFKESLGSAIQAHDMAKGVSDWHVQCSHISISYAHLKLGNLDAAFSFTQRVNISLENQDNHANLEQKYWLRTLYLVIGSIYGLQCKYTESIAAFEHCLDISIQLERDGVLPGIYNNLGYVNMLTGNIQEAHNFYVKGLHYAEKINNDYLKYFPISNLGNYFFIKGEIEKAEKLHLEGLELSEKIGHCGNILSQYRDLSQIYRYKGDIDKAVDFLLKSLELGEEIGNPGTLASILIHLIDIHLEQNNKETAIMYYHQLKAVDEDFNSTNAVHELTKYAQALILKSEGRIKPKSEAMIILRDIIRRNELDYFNISNAMLHLCELLLFEIRLTDEDQVLDELNTLVNKLVEYARENNLIKLQIEITGLQANMALITGEISTAINLTDQAIHMSKNYHLSALVTKFTNQKSRLIDQSDEWINVLSQQSTLSRLLEMSKVESYLQDIIKMKDSISKK